MYSDSFAPRIVAAVLLGGTALGLTVSFASAGGGKGGGPGGGDQVQLPTTLDDFDVPGTQASSNPNDIQRIYSSVNCAFCHGDYDIETAPYDTWVVSLMAQSARDPVFHAAFTIANQDADKAGAFCIRCHVPANHYRGDGDNAHKRSALRDLRDQRLCAQRAGLVGC